MYPYYKVLPTCFSARGLAQHFVKNTSKRIILFYLGTLRVDRGFEHFLLQLGPLERTKLELRGLKSGRPYLFQVCAKDLLDLGECSYWSSAVKITIP